MSEQITLIYHDEQWYNHIKTKHKKTMLIFYRIYCVTFFQDGMLWHAWRQWRAIMGKTRIFAGIMGSMVTPLLK